MIANAQKQAFGPNRTAAFTIVELLVVIAIIALLISLLMPALNKARTAAQSIYCASNMRQIGIAWTQYQIDNHDWIAAGARQPNFSGNWGGPFWSMGSWDTDPVADARWYNYLANGRFVNYATLNCPSLTYSSLWWHVDASKTAAQSQSFLASGGTTLPAGMSTVDGTGAWTCNYAYPSSTFGASEIDINTTPTFFTANVWWGPKKMRGGSKSLMAFNRLVMSAATGINGGMTMSNVIVVSDGTAYLNRTYSNSSQDEGNLLDPLRWVHGEGNRMNVLLADGHVGSVTKKDVFGIYQTVVTSNGPYIFYAR